MTSASDHPATRFACSVALACCLFATHASAADEYVESETRTAARVLAAQGSEAFERGEFAEALALFQRASAIIPAPTITLMEARTLVELGRLVEALEKYGATQRMLTVDPTNDAFRQAAAAADSETAALLQRLPTVRVRVTGAPAGEAIELQIDGRKVMPALAALDRTIDPGTHRIEAIGTSGARVSRELTLTERQHEDVVLVWTPAPVAKVEAPPPRVESQDRTLAWVVMGAGATFGVLGTVTGVAALNHQADLDKVCRPGCPATSADEISAFRRDRTFSYVGFALSAIGLGTGTYLLLRAPSGEPSVALELSPDRIRLTGAFQ